MLSKPNRSSCISIKMLSYVHVFCAAMQIHPFPHPNLNIKNIVCLKLNPSL